MNGALDCGFSDVVCAQGHPLVHKLLEEKRKSEDPLLFGFSKGHSKNANEGSKPNRWREHPHVPVTLRLLVKITKVLVCTNLWES